jgi:hypothetical protein
VDIELTIAQEVVDPTAGVTTMPENESAILSAIERLGVRFDTFRDEIKEEVVNLSERVIVLESVRHQRDNETNRFWNQTWPAQEKYLGMIDDRVRSLEREQVQQARIAEMEKQIQGFQTNFAQSKELEELKKSCETLKDEAVEMKTWVKITTGIAGAVGALGGAVILKLLHLG